METARPPSVADVERITALTDPVARNFQITQCYHELARAVAARTAGSANWCVFATWASKQAGQTIRGEDLEDAIKHAFDHSLALDEVVELVAERARALGATLDGARIHRILRDAVDPAAITARTADAVARGNLKVFAEIGREFARFIVERLGDAQFDASSIASFCAELRDGEPPHGQRFLRHAFTHYYRALFESNAKMRSELAFFASVEIGFHEQTRLQPEILEALNAAVLDPQEIRSRVIAALLPHHVESLADGRQLLRRVFGGSTPLDVALDRWVDHVRRELRRVITEHLMALTLARGVRLRLGEDLSAQFPPSLASLDDAELQAFVARVDPTRDSVRASGVIDWGNLPERMHFIADLFRCYHESIELLDPPFDAEQLTAIRGGES